MPPPVLEEEESHDTNFPLKIPRFLKVTNRVEDNDLDFVRSKLRKNQIYHMDFEPSYENAEGQRYFAKVYEKNRPEMVYKIEDLDVTKLAEENNYPTKNLFEHIINERGFANLMSSGKGAVTTLRTGYDPKQQRLKQYYIIRDARVKEHLQKVREIYGTRLYENFLEAFQKEE